MIGPNTFKPLDRPTSHQKLRVFTSRMLYRETQLRDILEAFFNDPEHDTTKLAGLLKACQLSNYNSALSKLKKINPGEAKARFRKFV